MTVNEKKAITTLIASFVAGVDLSLDTHQNGIVPAVCNTFDPHL